MTYIDTDYQALQDLRNSHGWKLLCEDIDVRIKQLEEVLLEPNLEEVFENDKDLLEKEVKLLKYKKMERKYLLNLKESPERLLNTKVTIQKS